MEEYKQLLEKIKAAYPNISGTITMPRDRFGSTVHKEYVVNLNIGSYPDNLGICRFTLRAMPTGCGSIMIHNWTNITRVTQRIEYEEFAKICKFIFTAVLDDLGRTPKYGTPGVIIATCGDYSRPHEAYKILKEAFEFKELMSYHNYSDGDDYMQTLLALKVEEYGVSL